MSGATKKLYAWTCWLSKAGERSSHGPTLNVATVMQETKQTECQRCPVFYLARNDLLIVGPSKTHTNQLGETDGERFLEDRSHVEFAKEFPQSHRHVRDTKDIKPIMRKCVMWSSILSCLSCLHSSKVRFADRSIAKKFNVAFIWNKSEKGVAKRVSITIMRFPCWTLIAITSFIDQRSLFEFVF